MSRVRRRSNTVIAAGIAAAIILAVNTLGTNVNTTFNSISTQLK